MLRRFTSESVSEGHPDKLCDKIADSILDACLEYDPKSRVACEVFATTGLILIGGEITTETYVDVQEIAREVARGIGYTDADYGLNCDSMAVLNAIKAQSPEIQRGVDRNDGDIGAGDQGIVYGFACDETENFMPAPITFAHRILQTAEKARKSGVDFLRPDAKSQVTVEYDDQFHPLRIDTVLVSHQHSGDVSMKKLESYILGEIIKPTLKNTGLLDDKTKYIINPSGSFQVGGPLADTGLTGRKIIVDSYGGMARNGGGAFSGKDPTKVDRSASYYARYIAKNIVAAKLARRCEVQIAYAIGVAEPVSVSIETFGTASIEEAKIEAAIAKVFDPRPAGIIKGLDLLKPIYARTTNYGHFGRDGFSWEKTDKTEALKNAIR